MVEGAGILCQGPLLRQATMSAANNADVPVLKAPCRAGCCDWWDCCGMTVLVPVSQDDLEDTLPLLLLFLLDLGRRMWVNWPFNKAAD